MRTLGRHLLVELYGCSFSLLDNTLELKRILTQAAKTSQVDIVKTLSHHFSPQGAVVVHIIEESHLIISTWPEYGYAAIDIFTCGKKTKPESALNFLIRELKPQKASVIELKRGILLSANP